MSTTLRATASTFKPGSAFHILKKKVSWHVQGITQIKTFFVEDDPYGYDTAFPICRKLIATCKSNIRNFDEKQAVPFEINPLKKRKTGGLVRQKTIRYNYCDN